MNANNDKKRENAALDALLVGALRNEQEPSFVSDFGLDSEAAARLDGYCARCHHHR